MTLHNLEQSLNYTFKNQSLLRLALTHRSMRGNNNERLEFLGDAILSYIIAEELYRRFPELREGRLSRLRSSLVNGQVLAEIGRRLSLGNCLKLGAGELKTGGRDRDSILADAIEAIIGAMYLDGGIKECRQCVLSWYGEEGFQNVSQDQFHKDPKSILQEWLQARKQPLPTYEFSVSGEAHKQTFEVICTVEGMHLQTKGTSTSRRKAEQIAASLFLDKLNRR